MNPRTSHCPHCGAPVDPGLKFCPRCGASLAPASPESTATGARFWHFLWQFLLTLGALGFGGVGACSAYALSTHQTVSRDIGDLSGVYWGVGLIAASCCALCICILWSRRKS